MATNDRVTGQLATDPEQLVLQVKIAQVRERLASSAGPLQRQLAQAVDWHTWIRRQPTLASSLAFGIGLLLGRKHKWRSGAQRRISKDHRLQQPVRRSLRDRPAVAGGRGSA